MLTISKNTKELMNRRLFYRAIVVMSAIAIAATISHSLSINMEGGEGSLLSLVASLILVFFLAPFLWWMTGVGDFSLLNEAHFFAAGFLDIIIYAFAIERVATLVKKWTQKKNS